MEDSAKEDQEIQEESVWQNLEKIARVARQDLPSQATRQKEVRVQAVQAVQEGGQAEKGKDGSSQNVQAIKKKMLK